MGANRGRLAMLGLRHPLEFHCDERDLYTSAVGAIASQQSAYPDGNLCRGRLEIGR
jgi:hypothetical protein